MLINILMGLGVTVAQATAPEGPYVKEVDGYINDARHENPDVGQPLELMPVPIAIREHVTFQDRVVNKDLTLEIQRQYEDTFQHTRTNQADIQYDNQFGTFDSTTGQWYDTREETERESQFAGYMTRRILEYHIENYAKSDPELRDAYEFKEKVTNYQVEVAPGYNFRSKYSLAGNFIEGSFENPYLNARTKLEMDPSRFGPTEIRKTRFSLDRKLTKLITMEAHYTLQEDFYQLIAKMPF